MLKLPRFKKGKPLNQYKPLRIGEPEGTECVSPKGLMENAIREAFQEALSGSQYEIKIGNNNISIKVGDEQ